MKSQHPNPNASFRLGVKPGGCADFYYTMGLDENTTSQDHVWLCNGIQVVVAAHSLNHINGLELDYSEDLMGGGFRFYNPNSAQSCGCGNSFSVTNNQ